MGRTDDVCDRFEDALHQGLNPEIEAFLSEEAQASEVLLRELLMIEWEFLQSSGEPIDPEAYCRRFPNLERFIQTALSEVLAGQETAPLTETVQDSSQPGWSIGESLKVNGQFEQIDLHAVGGLGEVYIAHDRALRRRVAVKRIKPAMAGHDESVDRFLLEAQITGRLEHPGIVPVHGIGADKNGQPFYVMKFIRGETLHVRTQRYYEEWNQRSHSARSLEFRKLLGHFLAACHAIDYGHNHGVIHRDIKPDNIMIGRYGETIVVDWGLARLLKSAEESEAPASSVVFSEALDPSRTVMGQALGTPAFMSPEQAFGRTHLVNERSDIYGLGATLYMLITGKRPFHGDLKTVMNQVREGKFERPRAVRRDAAADLEAICLKAMQLSPTQRYQRVSDLADDIEAYLDDQPVTARRESPLERGQRFLRKRQNLVLGAMLFLALTAIALVADAYRSEIDAHQTAEQRAESASRVSELFAGLKIDGGPSGLLGSDYKENDLLAAAEQVRLEMVDDPRIQTRLLDSIGDHFSMTGRLQDADRYLTPALDLRAKNATNDRQDQIELATSMHHVGYLRWNQGRYAEAKRLAAKAIELRQRHLGETHENTLASKVLYLMLLSEVVQLYDRRVIVASGDPFLNAWRDVLEAKQGNLSQGDLAGIYLAMSSTRIYQAKTGSWVSSLKRFGWLNEATAHFRRATTALEKHEGSHPSRFLALLAEAKLQRLTAPPQNPKEFTDKAIRIARVSFLGNAQHPGSLIVQLKLIGELPRDDHTQSELRRLCSEAEEVFGDQPRTLEFYAQLAEFLFHRALEFEEENPRLSAEYLSQSEQTLKKIIAEWAKLGVEESSDVAEARKRLGRIARERGDYEQAIEFFQATLPGYEATGIRGSEYFDHQARKELAECLEKAGRDAEARTVLEERRKIRSELLGRIDEEVEKLYADAPFIKAAAKD